MPLEVLDGALVLLGLLPGGEGSQVAALAGGGILPGGIEAIFAGLEFADHVEKDAAGRRNEAWGTMSSFILG